MKYYSLFSIYLGEKMYILYFNFNSVYLTIYLQYDCIIYCHKNFRLPIFIYIFSYKKEITHFSATSVNGIHMSVDTSSLSLAKRFKNADCSQLTETLQISTDNT